MINEEDERFFESLFSVLKDDDRNLDAILFLLKGFLLSGKVGAASACASRAILLMPDKLEIYKAKLNIYEIFIRNNVKNFRESIVSVSHDDMSLQRPEVVILCGGDSNRWQRHLGITQKHLIPIEGEILLQRTIRQITSLSSKITVVVKKGDSKIYENICEDSASVVEIESESSQRTPAWKYLSSKSFWNRRGCTIILLGDVWFSDAGIHSIFRPYDNTWLAFGRHSQSSTTGCPHGELFAFRFTDFLIHQKHLELLDNLYSVKMCGRDAAGWSLLQLMSNEDPNMHTARLNFVEIDDFTEDFDYPSDYEAWIDSRQKSLSR
jgi:hypothetical protein